jgi:5-methylcytosine-specific restriction endonuclease McrA
MKMIKLQRPPEPQKLIDNNAAWQQSLNAAIATHGSYKAIPDAEREKLIRHYKDAAVKTPLFESSHQKCAYCECNATEGGYIEIDHFRPKSIYPESVFEWNNLLPSCRQCNGMKSDHDTGAEPIINGEENYRCMQVTGILQVTRESRLAELHKQVEFCKIFPCPSSLTGL